MIITTGKQAAKMLGRARKAASRVNGDDVEKTAWHRKRENAAKIRRHLKIRADYQRRVDGGWSHKDARASAAFINRVSIAAVNKAIKSL